MSRLIKPFTEMSLKLVALDTINDRNISLQFPASMPQATFPGATTSLEQPLERPRARFAYIGGWHHGGINE
jgi:hypothetical protein